MEELENIINQYCIAWEFCGNTKSKIHIANQLVEKLSKWQK